MSKCYNAFPIPNSVFDIDIENIPMGLADKIIGEAPEDYFHVTIFTQHQSRQVGRCKKCNRNIYKTRVQMFSNRFVTVWIHARNDFENGRFRGIKNA
tara:strand:+ start:3041 stop:3331 length:291 start_codon:yes stop_codon:yes gene_type:complete